MLYATVIPVKVSQAPWLVFLCFSQGEQSLGGRNFLGPFIISFVPFFIQFLPYIVIQSLGFLLVGGKCNQVSTATRAKEGTQRRNKESCDGQLGGRTMIVTTLQEPQPSVARRLSTSPYFICFQLLDLISIQGFFFRTFFMNF